MTTNQKISGRILYLINKGMDVREAFNTVLGNGAYEKLAGEIWEAAQK